MTTEKGTKINRLLREHPQHAIFLSYWLEEQGISIDLQKAYRTNGWLEAIERGAMKRKGAIIDWQDGLRALQEQAGLPIHAGGRTALLLQGRGHYIPMGREMVDLFSIGKIRLPKWFKEHNWQVNIRHITSSFLPSSKGLTRVGDIKVSSHARAMMECLYLAPDRADLMECYELMEGLNNLLPMDVQELLESCGSIKVKRLFLYMAEKAKHSWLEYVDSTRINLGKGKRHLVKDGVFINKYGITVPKDVAHHE